MSFLTPIFHPRSKRAVNLIQCPRKRTKEDVDEAQSNRSSRYQACRPTLHEGIRVTGTAYHADKLRSVCKDRALRRGSQHAQVTLDPAVRRNPGSVSLDGWLPSCWWGFSAPCGFSFCGYAAVSSGIVTFSSVMSRRFMGCLLKSRRLALSPSFFF